MIVKLNLKYYFKFNNCWIISGISQFLWIRIQKNWWGWISLSQVDIIPFAILSFVLRPLCFLQVIELLIFVSFNHMNSVIYYYRFPFASFLSPLAHLVWYSSLNLAALLWNGWKCSRHMFRAHICPYWCLFRWWCSATDERTSAPNFHI